MCPFISCDINLNVVSKRYVRQNQKTDEFVAQIVWWTDSVTVWCAPCVNNIDGSLAYDWFIEAVLYNCRHTVICTGWIPAAWPITLQARPMTYFSFLGPARGPPGPCRSLVTRHTLIFTFRHFKCHLHLKWPVVHQKLHVTRNTAHRPSTQASFKHVGYDQKGKSAVVVQIAATLTISLPRWHYMSLTSYWGNGMTLWQLDMWDCDETWHLKISFDLKLCNCRLKWALWQITSCLIGNNNNDMSCQESMHSDHHSLQLGWEHFHTIVSKQLICPCLLVTQTKHSWNWMIIYTTIVFCSPVLISKDHVQGLKSDDEDLADVGCKWVIQLMQWGLVPHWHRGDPKTFGYKVNNARSDGMLSKVSFKKPLEMGRRCVVLADGLVLRFNNSPHLLNTFVLGNSSGNSFC